MLTVSPPPEAVLEDPVDASVEVVAAVDAVVDYESLLPHAATPNGIAIAVRTRNFRNIDGLLG